MKSENSDLTQKLKYKDDTINEHKKEIGRINLELNDLRDQLKSKGNELNKYRQEFAKEKQKEIYAIENKLRDDFNMLVNAKDDDYNDIKSEYMKLKNSLDE